jgi:hypothetical protein
MFIESLWLQAQIWHDEPLVVRGKIRIAADGSRRCCLLLPIEGGALLVSVPVAGSTAVGCHMTSEAQSRGTLALSRKMQQ